LAHEALAGQLIEHASSDRNSEPSLGTLVERSALVRCSIYLWHSYLVGTL
jgi:hypothetical protein